MLLPSSLLYRYQYDFDRKGCVWTITKGNC